MSSGWAFLEQGLAEKKKGQEEERKKNKQIGNDIILIWLKSAREEADQKLAAAVLCRTLCGGCSGEECVSGRAEVQDRGRQCGEENLLDALRSRIPSLGLPGLRHTGVEESSAWPGKQR